MDIQIRKLTDEKIASMPSKNHKGIISRMLIPRKEIYEYSCRHIIFDLNGRTGIHTHEREHVIYVLSGKIRIETGMNNFELSEGYIADIPSRVPHGFININEFKSEILVHNLYIKIE